MNRETTGGSAFPIDGTHLDGGFNADFGGMTLLDYFAAKALGGIMSAGSDGISQDLALNARAGSEQAIKEVTEVSYLIAAAMISERKKYIQ